MPALRRIAHPLALLALMWVIEAVDWALPVRLDAFGIRAWDLGSWPGIVLAPLLHVGWGHLIANSLPLAVFGCLIALEGARRFWAVTGITALIGAIGPWVFALPGTLTVGASGLVFGYFAYLLLRALFVRSTAHRILYGVIAVALGAVYGLSMLGGLMPWQPGISWQGHLFGLIGGGAAAVVIGRTRRAEPDRAPLS